MRNSILKYRDLILICFLVLFSVLASGCSFNEVAGSRYDYDVNIKGLDNCSGGNATEILVPMPMRNGSTLFTNANISRQKQDKRSNWSSEIVDTQYGKMISFNTSGLTLNNISFSMSYYMVPTDAPMSERKKATKEILSSPLSPISIGTAGKYTEPSSFLKRKGTVYNNTSYIYLDNNIESETANRTISVYIFLGLVEGSPDISKDYGDNHYVIINETIPADVRGWIPVTVQSDYPV